MHDFNTISPDLEQRAAPRHEVRLESPVLITALAVPAPDREPYFFLSGQLLDVSLTGLAFFISRRDLVELNMMGEDLMMQLLLPLPVKAIELEVKPVRYQRLDEGRNDKVLVGAHITNMNEADRALFKKFINDFETRLR